jgi:arylsulfatase A-like enzyme/Flp pilus assembly protein TadD
VVVTIDTLRADHVGAYGGRDVATPHLDGLARDGAMAPRASAHVPLTRPSHVSLFTGRLPTETGIRDNISPALVPAVPLLAEVLKKAGFRTAAFVSSAVLESSSGLDRGFDVYSDEFEGGAADAQFLNTVQKRGDRTTAEATAWLEKSAQTLGTSGRLFLWLHLYDPHDPYEPPEPYASRYKERPYDGEVAWSDELVGRVDGALDRLRLRGETALVVTSDHGEGLGEHGEALHGFFVYQSTLAVPLFIRGPGVKPGARIAGTVGLVDVYPAVLDLLGVTPPGGAQTAGRSLAPELRGQGPVEQRPVYAESLVPLLHFGWSDLRVLNDGRFKYIQAPRPELYDLQEDPGETRNLAAAQRSRAEIMRAALGRILDAERAASASQTGPPSVSTELLEKLGALGYVGGAGGATTTTPGADPKDRIQDFRIANDLIRQGLLRLHDRAYAESVARFRQVLARGIESFEVHFYMARALAGLGKSAEAVRHFEEAARRAPGLADAWEGMAGSLAALGRRTEARRAYEKALPLAPRSATLRARLGELLRDMGEIDEAIRRQREAAELAPKTASYWNSLGMTLGGNGRLAEAEKAFREATRLDDKSHRYAYNLGLILERQGRAAEARPWFEKALALDPRFAPARERLAEIHR